MTAAEANRRCRMLAADLIGDLDSLDVFILDEDGKLLPAEDVERMEAAVAALAARLRRVRKSGGGS